MSARLHGLRERGSWRLLLAALVAAFMVFAAACAPGEDPDDNDVVDAAPYEVWALDQNTNLVHIYQPVDNDGGTSFESVDIIDLTEYDVEGAHMIAFTSDYAYAVIASVGSGDTTIIRTEDREVVVVIPTGPGSHMAIPTPDGSRIIVDVIAEGAIKEITADWENEEFEISNTLVLLDQPLIADRPDDFENANPVCHDYTADGQFAYVTLGPGLGDGGLVVLDLDAFELVEAFSVEEVQVNCGTVLLPDGNMLLTGGGEDVGVWYVFDTENHEIVHQDDSRGDDAHGAWVTPDGSEIWLVNRDAGNGIVIDADTYDVIAEVDDFGGTPDILAVSPDGDFLFVSLRGPEPRTGAHLAEGDTPGFAVIDIASREVHVVIQPEDDPEESDFHGIGVRVIGD